MMHAVVAGVALAALSLPIGGTVHRKTEEGNRRYEEKVYDDALRAYTEAQVGAPEAPELHYDIGNVLYRQEKWDGASEAYARALLSATPTLAPSVSYNLGNALFRQEKYDEAARAYRRTLESVPGDRDAKRNLELSLRAAEEKKQQQKQGKDKKEQQPADGGNERKDEKQQQQAPKPEPRDEQDRSGKERRPAGGMTAEQAKNLLDSLREQEKAALKKQAERRAKQEESEPAEDW
jgi:tetratricopeptide (TPR) repeat protein